MAEPWRPTSQSWNSANVLQDTDKEAVEALRRRLLGSEFEDRVEDVINARPHTHGEYATYTDFLNLREEIAVLRSEVKRLRETLNPPKHPLDHDDPAVEGICQNHAEGFHKDPWTHHRACPLCWEHLHGTERGGTTDGNESNSDPWTR